MRRRNLALGMGAAILALVSGCQAAGAASEGARLEAEIRRLIGGAACTASEQCRTLAFGAKACGGPQSYLAWSTQVSDPAALRAAAERYAAWRREDLNKRGVVSDCALVVDPGAACVPEPAASAPGQGACRLLGGRAGGARDAR